MILILLFIPSCFTPVFLLSFQSECLIATGWFKSYILFFGLILSFRPCQMNLPESAPANGSPMRTKLCWRSQSLTRRKQRMRRSAHGAICSRIWKMKVILMWPSTHMSCKGCQWQMAVMTSVPYLWFHYVTMLEISSFKTETLAEARWHSFLSIFGCWMKNLPPQGEFYLKPKPSEMYYAWGMMSTNGVKYTAMASTFPNEAA